MPVDDRDGLAVHRSFCELPCDAGRIATLFTGLYPRVMVSSTDFANSLDVPGAASAHYTLAVMTVVALIVLPVVLLYQGWSYHVFRARVTGEDVELPEAVASPTGGSPTG